MEPPSLVTVSIMLNDTSPENGCFKIIPRSHKWGLQEWGRLVRGHQEPLTDRDDIDLSGQIDVPLSAGSALLFHSLVVHGSGANPSPTRGTPRYTPTSLQMSAMFQAATCLPTSAKRRPTDEDIVFRLSPDSRAKRH